MNIEPKQATIISKEDLESIFLKISDHLKSLHSDHGNRIPLKLLSAIEEGVISDHIERDAMVFFEACFPMNPEYFGILDKVVDIDFLKFDALDVSTEKSIEISNLRKVSVDSIILENQSLIQTIRKACVSLNTFELDENNISEILSENDFEVFREILLFCKFLNLMQIKQSLYIFYQKLIQIPNFEKFLTCIIQMHLSNESLDISSLIFLINRFHQIFAQEIIFQAFSRVTKENVVRLIK